MNHTPTSPSHTERRATLPEFVRSKPVLAVAWVLALGVAMSWLPGAETLRLWARPLPTPAPAASESTEEQFGEAELRVETRTRTELTQPEVAHLPNVSTGPIAEQVEEDFEVPKVDAESPPLPIADPSHSLHRFYAALERTARARVTSPTATSGPITRILYHGDSVVASDFVTGTLRRRLQAEFGDAGHGFVLMADAWPSYFHNDVFRFASRGWKLNRVVGPYIKDGFYGLGGVSFKAPPGVRARFGTAHKGKYGRRVSSFRVLYLEQPHGGDIQVNLDGAPQGKIQTAREAFGSGVYDVQTTDGEHMLELVTKQRFTRTFGVILERAGPGVVVDAIGIQGARLRFLDKQDDAHWAEQLQIRAPDLIVYQFGANESADGFAYSMQDYHTTMKAVLEQAMHARPEAGCLVIGAMDRARKEGTWTITVPIIPLLVAEQKATAEEVGCAFFNTFEAMGGKGSMWRWVRRGLGQADMTHPTGYGAQVLGNWIYGALMDGYNDYRLTRAEQLGESQSDQSQLGESHAADSPPTE